MTMIDPVYVNASSFLLLSGTLFKFHTLDQMSEGGAENENVVK